ncbi:hypothetical protein [Micromonospora sp. WMMD812]|uniref:hypothetical protein n=1 Tax=Micromonospora sp. WMMD812 TaxID=3015152 RepID=UPI00248CA6C8|nr:hypothetical protein [Micromonospora sp. WMMD812]WBB66106.1 hypothetical protein O7603_23465 [Micromonospora sp. WMMD812]
MGAERRHTEQVTDAEFARRRHVRFGELPVRVVPAEDLVETVDTEPAHEEPEQPMVRREWA